MIWRYHQASDGGIIKDVVSIRSRPKGEKKPDRHFSQTLLRNYYMVECAEGSRFRSIYSKKQIKKVHENRLQEFDETGRKQ
jgi:hypothetical protein